jgi:hypothetical protein
MSHSPALPTLTFYLKDGCELCVEAQRDLQAVLEARVKRGDLIARVSVVYIAGNPELEQRYGGLLPVIALRGQELALAQGGRTIDRFLDRVLGRLA